MSEPIVEIDLAALRWNFAQARALAASGAKLLPVIKSDAYGHGMVACARELAGLAPWGFAVSSLEEGLTLREAGFTQRILLLLGARPEEAPEVVRSGLTPVVFELGEAEALAAAAKAQGVRLPVHVKVDSGMGRLGFSERELPAALPRLAGMANLEVEGVCSHLACADTDDEFTREQLRRFQAALAACREAGLNPVLNHLSNSAALITCGGFGDLLGLARPGIMLYGGYPSERLRGRVELRPVMGLKARVLQVKEIECGETVSYGRTYCARGRERVAVIGCGYAHGYQRSLGNRGVVLIGGRRAPIRGRVCMNALMAAVSGVPDVRPGDEAVLLGSQGEEEIRAEELAGLAGTISYELFCAMGRLNQRRFINAAAGATDRVF